MEKDKLEIHSRKENFSKAWNIIENIIYYIILIPLIAITLMIVFQQIQNPEKVPNVFGWKMFIIMDENMDESVKYGDLVFTKNIDTATLGKGNIIAFRNNKNTVTIHKILDIEEEQKQDEETKEERIIRTFTMKVAENEVESAKIVTDSKVEGILKKRIPKVGLALILIQKPVVLAIIIGIILLIGLICLYIARKLDLRDERILQGEDVKGSKH